jgi:hypothetical protein
MDLAVVPGLTYLDRSQVFKRWLMPSYQTAFRWTGNRADAEDATGWVFVSALGGLRLPELVPAIDDAAERAACEAVARHWSDRYGLDSAHFSAVRTGHTLVTLGALFEELSAEDRLVLVLRFLRKRNLPAIAAQLRIETTAARGQMIGALLNVAERIGIRSDVSSAQAAHLAAFVDDLVARKKPMRFEVSPRAWAAMAAATHIQSAIAGNDLPRLHFVRSLEEAFEERLIRTPVTRTRIWSA